MTKLEKLLREWDAYRFSPKSDKESQRFMFDTDKERYAFILQLNEIGGVEYYLYTNSWKGQPNLFKVEVFLPQQERNELQCTS